MKKGISLIMQHWWWTPSHLQLVCACDHRGNFTSLWMELVCSSWGILCNVIDTFINRTETGNSVCTKYTNHIPPYHILSTIIHRLWDFKHCSFELSDFQTPSKLMSFVNATNFKPFFTLNGPSRTCEVFISMLWWKAWIVAWTHTSPSKKVK